MPKAVDFYGFFRYNFNWTTLIFSLLGVDLVFASKGLRFQLVALFLLFTVLPALLGAAASSYLNLGAYKETTIQSNLTAARLIGNEVKDVLDSSQGLVEALANAPAAKALDAAAVKDMIIAAQKANPHFELIFVMDSTGMQFARTSGALANRGDRQYFKEAIKGSTFFTDTYISAFTNAPTVTVAAPIRNNAGAVIGVFAADISLKTVWEIADRTQFGKTGYVDIVDNKGTIIAHPDKQRVLKKESLAEVPYVKEVISGSTGSLEGSSTRGDQSLIVYVPLDKYKWGVIAHEPTNEVFAAVNQAMLFTGILILFFLCAAGGAAFYIARGIALPLQALVGAADKVAHGDLSTDIQVKGVKEVNELAAKFNTMTASLRGLITKTASTSEMVASASQQLAAAAGQVGKASQEVASTIQHVAEGATTQVHLSSESISLINRMSGSIVEADAAAKAVAQASGGSQKAAEQGSGQVQNAVDMMERIRRDVEAAASIINNLGHKSRQIGQIVDVIAGIAGQTNLLALNAAIEAARAGEQGRGFAVVAEEVRKLAEQSETAAREISDIIGAIQSETGEAVSAMEKGSQEVVRGVEVVGASGTAFTVIFDAIRNMDRQAGNIVTMTERQRKDSNNVVEAVGGIADAARANAASAQQVAAASQEQNAAVEEIAASAARLAEMATELQEAVSKFKV